MNRTARSLVAVASATALAATVAAAAHATPVDIGDDPLVIVTDNTVWASSASDAFSIEDAWVFDGPVDPATLPEDIWDVDALNPDAFDGALAVFLRDDDLAPKVYYGTPDCSDGCTYVVDAAQNGDTIVRAPVEEILGLDVSVEQRFYADGDLARVLATYANPTDAPITVITGAFSDYGSDESMILEGDSSGDNETSAADHWIVTGDYPYLSDPIVTTAWSTPGAALAPGYAGLSDGGAGLSIDQSEVAFELTLQPGQTVRLAYFVKIHGWEYGPTPTSSPTATPTATGAEVENFGGGLAAAASVSADYEAGVAAAIADAAEFDTFSGRLAAGLAPGTTVLNWGSVPAAPADPATPVTAEPNFTG